jgi:hypothetical protein
LIGTIPCQSDEDGWCTAYPPSRYDSLPKAEPEMPMTRMTIAMKQEEPSHSTNSLILLSQGEEENEEEEEREVVGNRNPKGDINFGTEMVMEPVGPESTTSISVSSKALVMARTPQRQQQQLPIPAGGTLDNHEVATAAINRYSSHLTSCYSQSPWFGSLTMGYIESILMVRQGPEQARICGVGGKGESCLITLR